MNKNEAQKKALKLSKENVDEIILLIVVSKNNYKVCFDDSYDGEELVIQEKYLNGSLVL